MCGGIGSGTTAVATGVSAPALVFPAITISAPLAAVVATRMGQHGGCTPATYFDPG